MRRSSKIQLIALVVAVLGMLGSKFGFLPFPSGFFLFALALLVVVVIGLFGLLMFVIKLLKGSSESRGLAGRVAVIGLVPLIAIGAIVGPGLSSPPIHDITTDIANPPEFIAAKAARGENENSTDYAGEAIAAQQRTAFPNLTGITSDLTSEQAIARSLAVVDSLGWELLDQDAASGRIEAFEETAMFGFIDDVVIRIRATDSGSVIDLRSNSRVGEGDLGANEARIQRFIAEF